MGRYPVRWADIQKKAALSLGVYAAKNFPWKKAYGLYKRYGGRGAPRGGRMPRRTFKKGYNRTSGYYGRYNKKGRKFRHPELKFHDLALTDAVIAANGSILSASVNVIAQGTGESQRIGRKCNIESISWRFAIDISAGASPTASDDIVRVILYLDKQCNGSQPGVTEILNLDDVQSFRNLENKNRFRFLMDRTYAMNANAGGGDGTTVDSFAKTITGKFHKRINIPIEYNSTVGSLTEIRSNNIGVMLLSRSGVCGFDSQMRVRFSG